MKKLAVVIITALVMGLAPDLQAQDNIFENVSEMPHFPGDSEAYSKFLSSNLRYPKEAIEMGIEGKVDLSFIVDKDGTLSDFAIIRTIGGKCDKEVLRVFKKSPKWTPGKQDGKLVRTRVQASVSFKLPDNGKEDGK